MSQSNLETIKEEEIVPNMKGSRLNKALTVS
jgi:hypothetical protein